MKNNDVHDGLTLPGASRLAGVIQNFWIERGYLGVRAHIVALSAGVCMGYGVRSNIGPKGFPPKEALHYGNAGFLL